jgi:methyltransferase (TIGR00027 family)
MTEPLIRDVSDTSFWIAHHRAEETGRQDALFHDPLAARLAGARGAEIAASMPRSSIVGWTVVIRTRIIDDFIGFAIAEGVDTVLNLGAGLDTRPYRMALPASLHWIEADYPHLVEYKESQLVHDTPRCELERVRIDLADRAARQKFFSRVNAQTTRMLVLTEGLVPYLSVEEAAALADDLRALDRVRYWLLDNFSPEAMKFRQRKGLGKKMQNAPFKFAPGDWFGFFGQHGWRSKDIRWLAAEGERLGRPIPLPPFARLALKVVGFFMTKERRDALRKFAGYVLLEPR